MTLALKLLCRVIRRRLADGEALSAILVDYPKLSETEKQQVMEACSK